MILFFIAEERVQCPKASPRALATCATPKKDISSPQTSLQVCSKQTPAPADAESRTPFALQSEQASQTAGY